MNILQIRLSNIGCYEEKSFDFENLTVIHGENRTGKSTLVYALFFSIFGDHLNQQLTISDLARIGEPYGVTEVVLDDSGKKYRLTRTTGGIPQVFQQTSDRGDWEMLQNRDSDDLRWLIPVTPEMASLTSFFREGELIYFLRDIPKYNNTLIQNLVEMGSVFVTQSRFRKALQMAKEERLRCQKRLAERPTHKNDMETAARAVAALEKDLEQVDKELQSLMEDAASDSLSSHEKRLEELRADLDRVITKKQSSSPIPKEADIAALKEKIKGTAELTAKNDALQVRMGKGAKALEDIENDIAVLSGNSLDSICRLCGSPLSSDRIAEILAGKKEEKDVIALELKKIESELVNVLTAISQMKVLEGSLHEKEVELKESQRLEKEITKKQQRIAEMEKELAQHKTKNPKAAVPDGNRASKGNLEKRRNRIQKDLIDAKVRASRLEEDYHRYEENKRRFQKSERDFDLCEIASKSLNNAIRSLNSILIEGVRENLRNWSHGFGFLKEFDINISSTQLSPIIQAKGYQYKLNQMSKSERIFLYLMLKLAIGDALSHMGVFILDDPADGLDRKRKDLLARLLMEVSSRRQLILTTNDPEFAGMFQDCQRIDL